MCRSWFEEGRGETRILLVASNGIVVGDLRLLVVCT
jgi:hypothetical protein